MLHIVRFIQWRYPNNASTIIMTLVITSGMAVVLGTVIALVR